MMNGLINTVIDGIQQEIINKKYIVKPIRYRKQTDKCNGKIRNIGIQDIKQQIYDYIIRFRRTAKKARVQLRKDKDVDYQTAKSFIGRYGAVKNSNTKHFRKKYHIPYILKRCEVKISKIERRLTHANNEIQFATA